MRLIRVFISSPGDAENERKRIVRVMERLNAAFAGTAQFKPVLWEERFYSAHDGFQQQIERSTDCDIVVAILRGRLGTPLPPDFMVRLPEADRLPDAAAYQSGTAYEILSAIAARRRGAALPDIFVFRYPQSPLIGLDDENRADIEEQWQKLKSFAEQVFVSTEGHFRGAYQTFSSTDDFETQAEGALRQWLSENVLEDRAVVWPIAIKGSPFRGLEPFGAKHAEVFYGRDGDRGRALDRLKDAADSGFPFLAIIGPSGAGKSSFARAGILPWLVKPGAVTGVGVWRTAVMRPSDHPNGAIASLARHLFDDEKDIPEPETGRPVALPELTSGDYATPQALAGLFSVFARGTFEQADDLESAGRAALAPIEKVLKLIAESDRKAWGSEKEAPARLLLVIDQFDELFAPGMDDAARAAFARLIERLARSGLVWIVATLRAEFYEAFLKSPLARLASPETAEPGKRLELTFDLLPPGLSEMAEIVRGPARAAGLVWETDPAFGERLDNRLLADIDLPDLLPLVQFVLEQLYEQRVRKDDTDTLTFDAYRALGKLDGAIDKAAEKALSQLGPAEQAALPRLLRALVTYARPTSGSGNSAVALIQAQRRIVAHDAASARLIGTLTEARILVSGNDQDKAPTVALAHQRVIDAWQRARKIVAESEWLLRVRDDIESQRLRWMESGRSNDRLIPAGLPLYEAENALTTLADELSADTRTYIVRSGRVARLRQTLTAAVAIIFMAVSAYAAFMWTRANEATVQALAAREDAQKQRDAALLSQSRYLADLSKQKTAEGNAGDGILLALEALPDPTSTEQVKREKAFLPDAELALNKALNAYREIAILREHTGKITGVSFGSDPNTVLSSSADGSARVWDREKGRETAAFRGHSDFVMCVAVTPDGKRAVTGSRDNTARVWDLATGHEILKLTGHNAEIHSVAVAPDGSFIVTGSYDNTLRIWDARTGAVLRTLTGHTANVLSVAISPDRSRIVSGSNDDTARVWDTQSGAELFVLHHPGLIVPSAIFSSDGTRIFTGSGDGKIRIWSATNGELVSTLDSHKSLVSTIAVATDGATIASAAFDNDIRLWDAATGAPLAVLKGHVAEVTSLRFSGDGSLLVSGSRDGTIRIWDARRDDALRILKGHTAEIDAVAISPRSDFVVTGARDATASVWDLQTGALRFKLEGSQNQIYSVAVTSDGKKIVTASGDHTVRVWDAATGNQLAMLDCGVWPAVSVTVSPDSSRIFAGLGNGTIKIWDATSGNELLTLHGHKGTVFGLAVTEDGSRILSTSMDNTSRVWDVKTGEELKQWKGDNVAWYVTVSPDSSKFAFSSADGYARLFDLRTYKFVRSFHHQVAEVLGIAFTPDGKRLVTSTGNGNLLVWDVESGTLLSQIEGHGEKIQNLAVSSDGERIVSVSADATARIWQLAPAGQELVEYAKKRVLRCFIPDERTALSLNPQPELWCGKLDKWPYDPVSARLQGSLALAGHDDAGAEMIFSTTLAAHPDFKSAIDEEMADAYVNRGASLLKQKQTKDAAEQFNLAISRVPASKAKIDSTWGDMLFDEGRTALNTENDSEAQSAFSAAEQHNAELSDKINLAWATAYYQRGVSALQASKEQEARSLFDKVIARRPDLENEINTLWASAYQTIGANLFDSGDEKGAYEKFELAKKLKPEFAEALETAITEALIKRGLRKFAASPDEDTNADLDAALKRDSSVTNKIDAGKAGQLIQVAETILNGAADDNQNARLPNALNYLKRASDLAPKSDADVAQRATIARDFGRVYLKQSQNANALKSLHEASILGSPNSGNYESEAAAKVAQAYLKNKRFEDAFLVSAISFFDQKKAESGPHFKPQLMWSLGKLYRFSNPSNPLAAMDCDVLAGANEDPLGVAPGVDFNSVDAVPAITACQKAVKEQPTNARFHFELGRALASLAQVQRSQKQVDLAETTDRSSFAELKIAADQGYPWAFLYSASNYQFGYGVLRDETKANNYAVQAFNRTLNCCWVPIARKLLEGHHEQAPETARHIIIDMTGWAASLGNKEAGPFYGKLTGNITVESFPIPEKPDFAALPPWVK